MFSNVHVHPLSDDQWSDEDAAVVCRMLNFTTAWSMATKKSTFGYDSDSNYIMDDVGCKGTERKLDYCPNKYYHDCKAGEAAGVICYGNILLLENLIVEFTNY